MKKIVKRRIEISVETHEIKIIRIRGGGISGFCRHCGAETSLFSPEEIARFLKIPVIDVSRDIESGKFHLTETDGGTALICGDSLRR
jgi:hypothetical protein